VGACAGRCGEGCIIGTPRGEDLGDGKANAAGKPAGLVPFCRPDKMLGGSGSTMTFSRVETAALLACWSQAIDCH
jgi:hypothetical protein